MTDSGGIIKHPLTYARQQRSWTLRDVAEIVRDRSGLNMASWRQKVWRWERGVVPEIAAQYALAEELGIDRAAVRRHRWPAWLLLLDPAEPVDTPWTHETALAVLSRVNESAALDRRGFLILTGEDLVAAAATWSLTPPEPAAPGVEGGRIGAEAVQSLQARVERLWHLDDRLGGGSCLEAARADLGMVTALLRAARYNSDTAQGLMRAAAGLARFAGWAAFDSGLHAAAQRYWHAALRASHAAEDVPQGVYVLSNLALQAIYTGDGRTAIRLIELARSRADRAHATMLAILDTWQARAHSLLGEVREAAHLLNRADEVWSRRHPEDDPPWVYWMPQPSLTAEAGTTLAAMGEPRRAEEFLRQGLAGLPEEAARERDLYLIRIAEAQLRDQRLAEAVHTAAEAVDATAGVESVRVRERIADFVRQLPPGQPLTELRDRLRAATERSVGARCAVGPYGGSGDPGDQ